MKLVSIQLGSMVTLFVAHFLFSACTPEPKSPPRVPRVVDSGALDDTAADWSLLWSDEFDGLEGEGPNPEIWRFDIGGHGWGNQQLEHNTDRRDNSVLNGQGQLELIARREDFSGNQYTSARLHTRDRFEVKYGRIEANVQLPRGQGIWPAFWMLGAEFPETVWPDCGEIDIMEFRGQETQVSTGAVHGRGFSGGQAIHGRHLSDVDLTDDFHTYAVEWSPNKITWFVDESRFFSVDSDSIPKSAQWPFQQPFFLIMNIAVGGSYVGSPDETTTFPQRMLVDYVRVYQRGLLDEGSRQND